jgi:hypothetical protein
MLNMEKQEPSDKDMSSSIQQETPISLTPSIKEAPPPESNFLQNPNSTATEHYQYITGFKLALVIVLLTFVAFLAQLDTTIVVTVSLP